MGAVYRATDTKLHREVAIKILPPAFSRDTARMQRFEREARVLASLNHPNIAAIYGIEQAGIGQGAIVMELVEGENPKGPVPLETALSYARQIADALEYAHERGIVHRDLKPANIKVTPDGAIKLLDFGLAKASEPGVTASGGESPTVSPTLSLEMTQAGMVLGTAAYMAPEQAAGKPVDRRADIWAFGVVLYELLTGDRLFAGETTAHTIAEVLRKEIDVSRVPARFRRLLRACLERDPRLRLQSIGDMRLLLEETEPETPARSAGSVKRPWLPWAAAVLGLAAGFGAAALWLRPRPLEAVTVRFPLVLPEGVIEPGAPAAVQATPSPDGRFVAFAGNSGSKNALWVRPLASPSAHQLEKTEGANFPFWTPTGNPSPFSPKTN